MRNIIKRWLGIDKLATVETNNDRLLALNHELRVWVLEIVDQRVDYIYNKNIHNRVTPMVDNAINLRLGHEGFIDDIVARINRKQLGD